MKQERYHAAAVGRSKAGSLGHPTTPIHIHCIARLVGDDDDYQDGDNDDHYSHDDHDTMLGPLLGHPNLPPSTGGDGDGGDAGGSHNESVMMIESSQFGFIVSIVSPYKINFITI